MARYRLFDSAIETEFPLRVPETDLPATFRFEVSPDAGPTLHQQFSSFRGKWIVEHLTPGDEPWLSVGRTDAGTLLRFHDMADFVVAETDGHIVCRRCSGVPDETIRHLLVSQVIPRILNNRGEVVLHGSAVTIGGRGLAFVGRSGSGKSTLVAGFARSGAAILTDDGLMVREDDGQFVIVPSYPEGRLWPDTADALFPGHKDADDTSYYSGKLVLTRGREHFTFNESRQELGAMVFLADAEDRVAIGSISSADAYMRLMRDMFRLIPPKATDLSSEFEMLLDLIESIPCVELAYPRRYESLTDVVGTVTGWFGEQNSQVQACRT